MRLKRVVMAFWALLAGAMALPNMAVAQSCGISGTSASGQTTLEYDPFNPAGLGTSTVTLSLTRVNPSGGNFTREVRFFLRSTGTAADGATIIPTALVSGNANVTGVGQNIFYNFAATPPILTGNPTAGNRFLLVDFTGNNAASNTVQVSFQISLPPNADLTATSALAFDVVYTCTANPNITGAGTSPNAIVFPVNVLSALQASWVGSDLDFGEVGDKTTVEILAAPGAYTKTGNIRVASSGPYQVTLSSQNDYRLTYPGGNLANANERLDYSLLFLGAARTAGSASNIVQVCDRASLAGRYLPIQVALQEGGNLKTPAPVYRDVLTVTFQPQVVPSANICGIP